MSSQHWARIEELFHATLERSPPERARFLEEACGADDELRREVQAMLAADAGSTAFVDALNVAGPRAAAGLGSGAILGAWRLERELAEGGMGTVWLAGRADGTFEQQVAIKVLRRRADSARVMQRFELERRTLARLEHPGIGRLIDGGTTAGGLPYLVMEFVDGEPIDEYCDRLRLSIEERLGLFREVCDAVHYAHQNLVVHRDLKPANLLVDAAGRARLLDFGIAKVLDPLELPGAGELTVEGERLMTPAYASPEQVRGEEVTTATDVYSLCVVLYELLTGHRPYAFETGRASEVEHAICERDPERPSSMVRRERRITTAQGTTRRLSAEELGARREVDPRHLERLIEGDLDRIVLKGMQKDPARRYASAAQLSEDLRRHLRGLPVRARADTWGYRASKFVRRNKLLVGGGTLLALSLVLGIVGTSVQAGLADRRLSEVLRLSDRLLLDQALEQADELWPAHPDRLIDLDAWLLRAQELVERLPRHRRTLEDLRDRGTREAAPDAEDARWVFDTTEEQWRHDTLAGLVRDLERFAQPGLGTLADVEARRAFAGSVRQRTIDDHAEAWERATASIADPDECPAYGGLRLTPQVGLIPLGPDPDSGLWEFAHLQTGTPAELPIGEPHGLVFVLLPGGEFRMGAARPSPGQPDGAPNVDALAMDGEAPAHTLRLDPFFASKYEMTRGQWQRFTGEDPSATPIGPTTGGERVTAAHPVENVTATHCDQVLGRLGLALPTEAQWEYLARGGTSTRWWTGNERESLQGLVNLADRTAARLGRNYYESAEWPELDDGHGYSAPVDAYEPNGFGLFQVAGNVMEWCADGYVPYDTPWEEGTGAREPAGQGLRSVRGGNFGRGPLKARSAQRHGLPPEGRSFNIGLRPIRRLDP